MLSGLTAQGPTSAPALLAAGRTGARLGGVGDSSQAYPTFMTSPNITLSATPVGYSPAQIRGAYGLGPVGSSTITFGAGIQGDGSGQTIAIVDVYDDPNAASDLHNFDLAFGLPDAPSFTKVNENGQSSPLPITDPGGAFYQTGNLSWAVEESLDIEWAHVMAPAANIVLVECDSPSDQDLLINGALTAGSLPGVSVVSMSFGHAEEPAQENLFDQLFFTPAGHNGVTFVASTGDNGSPSGSPAYSQAVLAVGGTSLTVGAGNTYGGETAWPGSGGGIADSEYQPSFQAPYITGTTRSAPDVSMVADPNTGVGVYDSFDFTAATPWLKVGGTSLAAPLWAGMMAVVNQGRIVNGLNTLDGAGQTLPLIYGLPSSDFHDITSGSNGGFSAGAGYDLVTGRGSPIGNLVIPALASAAAPALKPDLQPFQLFESNTGTLWSGAVVFSTQNGVHSDPAMIHPGDPIYLNAAWYNDSETDVNPDFLVDFQINGQELGSLDSSGGLPSLFINATVDNLLGNIGSGFTTISMNIDSGGAVSESTETNNTWSRTYGVDSASNENYVVMLNPAGTTFEVLVNNVVKLSVAKSSVQELSLYLSGSNDTVTVDSTNGNPLPLEGLTVNGNASSNDTLTINGSSGNNAILIANDFAELDTVQINYANMASVSINAGGGTDSLEVDGTESTSNTISVGTSQLTLDGQFINYSNLEKMTILTGTGDDALTQLSTPGAAMTFSLNIGSDIFNVNGGSYTFNSDAALTTATLTINVATGGAVTFGASQHLAALNVTGGSATLAAGGSKVIVAGSVSAGGSGKIDLTNNAMIVNYSGASPLGAWNGSAYTGIAGLLQTGYASGWTGAGIDSSSAGSSGLFGLAVGEASNVLRISGAQTAVFNGQAVDATSVLIKFTYAGDANMDGRIDADDYFQIDSNYNKTDNSFKSYLDGDFDYNGLINGDDYFIIDSNFNAQGLQLAAPLVESGADETTAYQPAAVVEFTAVDSAYHRLNGDGSALI